MPEEKKEKPVFSLSDPFLYQPSTNFRYIGYSYIYMPWWVLVLEPLHGVTWALMFTVVQSYAASLSPPHLTATGPGIAFATNLAGTKVWNFRVSQGATL